MAAILSRPSRDSQDSTRAEHSGGAVNPYAASGVQSDLQGIYGDAKLLRGAFLYRVIDCGEPTPCRIVYDGWWFRQKIEVNGYRAWFQISWLTIQRHVQFRLPAEVDARCPAAKLEIEFGHFLRIRRFRLWIDDQLRYDEIA